MKGNFATMKENGICFKSVSIEKCKEPMNLDELDRVPVDFSDPNGPALVTDSDEIGFALNSMFIDVCFFYSCRLN